MVSEEGRPVYFVTMPRLWQDTIEEHRRSVRDAILDTAAALVTTHGLRSVTMSEIAQQTGIGRATLYKYFPDVDSMLLAWHERQIRAHIAHLQQLGQGTQDVGERLEAVLEAYALIHFDLAAHHRGKASIDGTEISALLHRGEHVAEAHGHLHAFVQALLTEAAGAGVVRDDVASSELATYCIHTSTAAGALPSKAAVRRLVQVTLAGLRASAP